VSEVLKLFSNAFCLTSHTVFTHYTFRSMFVNRKLRYKQFPSSMRIIFYGMDALGKLVQGSFN
jgi:hypothetical protein